MTHRGKNALTLIKHQLKKHRKELIRRQVRRKKRLQRLWIVQRTIQKYGKGITRSDFKKPYVKQYLDSRVKDAIRFKSYTHIKAPRNFSFLKNTNEVLVFIGKLERCLKTKVKTFVVFEDVVEMHQDAIVVLLSILKRFNQENIDFNGDFPLDKVARQVLEESQFFTRLYGRTLKKEHRYSNQNNSIHTRTEKKVDVELASRLIDEASLTVWGEKKRCQGIYRILIELMTNTHNHAEIGQKGSENWHLCVSHLRDDKKVVFTFVDYGVGVINSLQNKKPGEKMYGFIDKFIKFINIVPSNADVIREIFLEERQVSSTGESYRGYGLPSLFNSFLEQDVMNLNYITNNVRVNAKTKQFKTLSENFSGTFIYWELSDTCTHLNGLS